MTEVQDENIFMLENHTLHFCVVVVVVESWFIQA